MYSIDKLYESVAQKGPVCVGLDTAPEYLPPDLPATPAGIWRYNQAIIDATWEAAPCFKVQIAYYEALGIPGLEVYAKTLRYIRQKGGLVIGDIKRGDIADTARKYAEAHFAGEFEADFVTLSPYMGLDSLEPWLDYAERFGKGAFVLLRTSNKGMRDFQYLELKSGGRLYHAVLTKLSDLAKHRPGACGYGIFGAVAGCTDQEDSANLRQTGDKLFFLIPGYGAQGGEAAAAATLLKNGNGGVVNASRSILRAWQTEANPPGRPTTAFAAEAARRATLALREDLRAPGLNRRA
ncbi:MAG: orotidine-5'-phosphate decarboxylase [Spirochaetaceae bacterium]|jgi:orotidine-5'-phosphate decarboxylase|nr:orotidine-5'-phosphate decarboxylase [Spirochaetaceae bacterium]